MISGPLQASIGAALIEAGLSFDSNIGATGSGEPIRLFRIPYALDGGALPFVVTLYIGGEVLVALSPLRITADSVPAKRSEIAEYLVSRVPFVRLVPDLRGQAESSSIAWIEAGVPVIAGQPLEASFARTPLYTVVSATEIVHATFSDCTEMITVFSIPIFDSTSEPRSSHIHGSQSELAPKP
jgi:hypothetical protein